VLTPGASLLLGHIRRVTQRMASFADPLHASPNATPVRTKRLQY
jgi:hypothetical protein